MLGLLRAAPSRHQPSCSLLHPLSITQGCTTDTTVGCGQCYYCNGSACVYDISCCTCTNPDGSPKVLPNGFTCCSNK